jgi:homoserine kinase
MIKRIRVTVPATTANLGPGFDVLGAALTLYNKLEVVYDPRAAAGPACPEIVIEGEGRDALPCDRSNIVWRSMERVFAAAKRRPAVKQLRLVNNIPLAAGLGSSAAARLSGILAANALCGNRLSTDDMLEIGVRLEGHPDNIVPALVGGLCISFARSLRDHKIRYVKLSPPRLKAVICTPGFELATARARMVLPGTVPLGVAVYNSSRLALLMAALQGGRYELLSMAMEDRLHQPSRARLIPGMEAIFEAARTAGAFGAALSGAGPSLIALCAADRASAVGGQMQQAWQRLHIDSRYFVLGFDARGATVR